MKRLHLGRLISFLISIPVRLLRPILFVRLVKFHTNFGFLLRSPLQYRVLREVEDVSKLPLKLDIIFWSNPVPDRDLVRFWMQSFRLLPDFIHNRFYKSLIVVGWYWKQNPSMRNHILDFTDPFYVSPYLNSPNYDARQLLRNRDRSMITSCLEELNVGWGPIALLHVRDPSHDVQTQSIDSYDQHLVNADASTFQPAVDFLVNRGYSVLTVGNHPTSKSKLRGVSEYHRSASRSPLMDLLIGSTASLYLGTAAGAPFALALDFKIPSVLTNYYLPCASFTSELFSFGMACFIPKSIARGDCVLTQSEVMALDLPVSDRGLSELGLRVIDNSSEEILNALIETLKLGKSLKYWAEKRAESDQLSFWKVFNSRARNSQIGTSHGAIVSSSFLRQNPNWIR